MSEEIKKNIEAQKGGCERKRRLLVRALSTWLPVFVLSAAFLAGALSMWLKANRTSAELSHTQRELRLEKIQLALANAALDARRGDYEAARKFTAGFFGSLTHELDQGIGSALPTDAFYDLQPLLEERDDLITLLARSDPASGERLGKAYILFRDAAHPNNSSPGGNANHQDVAIAAKP